MEDLNKNQIVLLTLLVSFVTSIATGIMTVSLLQEAPLEVTRNINRIVERTIEKVTPANVLSAIPQKEVTTIIVKEEDSIVEAVNQSVKSIVRITEKAPGAESANFYAIGLVIGNSGLIATDRKTILSDNTYLATMSDGVELKLVPEGVDKKTNFILFKAVQPETVPQAGKPADKVSAYIFTPVSLADALPRLGQTLIAVGGQVSNAVSVGRVASLEMKDSTFGTTTAKVLAGINTDISSEDIVVGAPILNLSGHVVGIKLSSDASKSFTPVETLKKELAVLIETLTPKAP